MFYSLRYSLLSPAFLKSSDKAQEKEAKYLPVCHLPTSGPSFLSTSCGLPCWFKCEAWITMTCDLPVRTLSGCGGFPSVSLVLWPLKGQAVGATQTQLRVQSVDPQARIMAFPSGKLPRYICIPPIPDVNPGQPRKGVPQDHSVCLHSPSWLRWLIWFLRGLFVSLCFCYYTQLPDPYT